MSLNRLNGCAPGYLSSDLQYVGRRRAGMRSASAALLIEVPRTRSVIGDQLFSIAGLPVWISLPATVRYIDSSLRFDRKQLKAFLFA